MRAAIVYESMFGNTQQVAETVAKRLRENGFSAEAIEVSHAPNQLDCNLLIVGGPTHAFGMSRPATRDEARKRANGPLVSSSIGVREWLQKLQSRPWQMAVAFSTRTNSSRLFGSASRGVGRQLRRLGFEVLPLSFDFVVADTQGPLFPRELEHAREWADELADAARRRATHMWLLHPTRAERIGNH